MSSGCGALVELDERAAREKLLSAVEDGEEGYTVSDLILRTGLPAHQVQEIISRAASDLQGHMRVTDSGEIIYYFPERTGGCGRKPVGRGRPQAHAGHGWAEQLRRAARLLPGAGVLGGVGAYTLVFFFLLFPPVPLLLLSLLGGSEGDRRALSFGASYYPGVFLGGTAAYPWGCYRPPVVTGHTGQRTGKPGRPAWTHVLESLGAIGRLEDSMRLPVLTFIGRHKGVLVLEELLALCGKLLEEAEQLLGRLLADYQGEPAATNAGSVVYLFPKLMNTHHGRKPSPQSKAMFGIRAAQDRAPDDDSRFMGRWLCALSGFNLLIGVCFLIFGLSRFLLASGAAVSVQSSNLPLSFLYKHFQELLGTLDSGSSALIALVTLGVIPIPFSAVFWSFAFIQGRIAFPSVSG